MPNQEIFRSTFHRRIKKLDVPKHLVTFRAPSLGSLRDEKGLLARYYVENIFEALDTPGQWYLDRPAGRLYYLPLAEEDPATAEVIAPALETLVWFEGSARQGAVKHIRLENLTFRHAEWVLPADHPGSIQAAYHLPGAIQLAGAENCVLYGCEICYLSQYAVEVLAPSSENKIIACTMYDLGAGGVKIDHEVLDRIDETATRKLLNRTPTPMRTTVSDCTIYQGGAALSQRHRDLDRKRRAKSNSHNHIFDLNYTGISCGWTWGYAPTRTVDNRIEYNHIHHINHREILSDNGGIYTLGIQPGTTIRGNVIHDISHYGYSGLGIYLDQGSSGIVVENNLTYRTKGPGFATHFGRDNVVQNNIFALSEKEHVIPVGKFEKHRTTLFQRNIVYWTQGELWNGSWKTDYNLFKDNLFFNATGRPVTFANQSLAYWQERGQHENTLLADPLFQDPQAEDFSIRTDSPAFRVGFKPFDPTFAGPRFKGRRPASYTEFPYQDDEPREVVQTTLETLYPVLNDRHRPGRIKLTLKNHSPLRVSGKIVLKLDPPTAQISVPAKMVVALKPHTQTRTVFTVQVPSGTEKFSLETQPSGPGLVPAFTREAIEKPQTITIPRLPSIRTIDEVAGRLSHLESRSISVTESLDARITLAAAGRDLAVMASVDDPYISPTTIPWEGSCLEVFGTMSDQGRIGQLFLQPATRTQKALASRYQNSQAVPDPTIRLKTVFRPGGYFLYGLIPFKRLGWNSGSKGKNGSKKFLLELKLSIKVQPNQPVVCGRLFESFSPSMIADGYGSIVVQAPRNH